MKYFDVYFRIKSNYNPTSGFSSSEQKAAFNKEVTAVFENDDWKVIPGSGSGHSSSAQKDRQELYLHPMSFSGVICEDSIAHLHNLFSAPELTTFSCYHVDVYKEYRDLTDDEYLSLLHSREDAIATSLLEMCRTKRKNLFAVGQMTLRAAEKFAIPRVGKRLGYDKEHLVVRDVFDRLIKTGLIEVATTKNGVGYRTVIKKEEPICPMKF